MKAFRFMTFMGILFFGLFGSLFRMGWLYSVAVSSCFYIMADVGISLALHLPKDKIGY